MEPLPAAFIRRMMDEFEDGAALLEAIERGDPVAALRLNPFKPACLPGVLRQVPWESRGFYTDGKSIRAGSSILHAAGAFYMQEASAMAAAPLLGALPGERVLDLCAAPGGKSGQLAADMAGQGLLVCNETEASRAAILAHNLERLGIRNALIISEKTNNLVRRWPRSFDRVLADAPCSGEGMFRRDPGTRAQWSPRSPQSCARRQRLILDAASRLVKPDGIMVYSTCTFNWEENEGVIEAFLQDHPAFSLEKTRRILPHLHEGEGHFAALLRNREIGGARSWALLTQDEAHRREWRLFTEENLADPVIADWPLLTVGETLYAPPPGCPVLDGLRVVRAGVQLAFLRKGRLEPAHGLAMALRGEQALRKVGLDAEAASLYLRGHPLPSSGPRGWALVCHQGLPLGWGKIADGQIKNHLPKGLRWNR